MKNKKCGEIPNQVWNDTFFTNGFTLFKQQKPSCRHPELDSGSRRLLNKERFRIKYGMTFLLTTLYPAQKPSGMTKGTGNGFTLIELLVVVLIIGILAAVALPQYKKAVEKSRFANYLTLANSLVSSIRVSYMASGSWTVTFDELGVNLPADMNTENTISYGGICRKNSKNYCCMTFPSSSGDVGGGVRCGDTDYNLIVMKVYADIDGTPSDGTACAAKEEPYKSVCKSLSGKTEGVGTAVATPDDWIGGYVAFSFN